MSVLSDLSSNEMAERLSDENGVYGE
jgi:hypothetical protein